MDKLTAAQQQQVKKMSNDRLRVKLIAAGYDEDEVLGYERDDLMSLYAGVLASGKPKAGPVGYDPELERQKLAFEKAKWETEQRRWEAEMEAKRVEAEKKKLREEREFEEKKTEAEERKRKEEWSLRRRNARRRWSLKSVNVEKR